MRCNRYRIQVSTTEQFSDALQYPEVEYIYVPMRLTSHSGSVSIADSDKDRVILVPPVFIGGNEGEIASRLRELVCSGYSRALAHTIGHIPLLEGIKNTSIHGGLRLNIANSESAKQYANWGVADLTVSIEMGLHRIKSMRKELQPSVKLGAIVYGKLPMMLLRRIPNAEALTDVKGKHFQIVRNENEAELLNPTRLILSDKMADFSVLDFAVLLLSPGESFTEILGLYKNGANPTATGNFTRGLY